MLNKISYSKRYQKIKNQIKKIKITVLTFSRNFKNEETAQNYGKNPT